MASRVLPHVRLAFPCDEAVRRADGRWVLTNPRAVIVIPAEVTLPITVREIWVYVQLTEGVGAFDLAIELRYVHMDDTRTVIGRGKPTSMTFLAERQLQVIDTAFHLTRVPLSKHGMYEFAVVATANDEPSQVVTLLGQTALFRVLD